MKLVDDIKLREINEIIGKNPYSKKNHKLLYDYIVKYIEVPQNRDEVEVNELRSICNDCDESLVCHPAHAIKKNLWNFWGTGNTHASIMFVMINPGEGKTDIHPDLKGITETGVNLSGRGAVLRLVAKLAGY